MEEVVKIENEIKKILNQEPKNVKRNEYADNSEYIPISHLEMLLDDIFDGLWSTKGFNTKVIGNEIVGELELHYFHPVHKTWLCRVGAAAVIVRQKQGADITDIKSKIKNALVLDYPHLKAEAFRNACKSVGKLFGRDLNREYIANMPVEWMSEEYNELTTKLSQYSSFDELKKDAIAIRDEFVGKGLQRQSVEEIIRKRLVELK